jgi:hypothetical protein
MTTGWFMYGSPFLAAWTRSITFIPKNIKLL